MLVTEYKEIPSFGGDFSITLEGILRSNRTGKKVKVKYIQTGCTARLKRKRRTKTFLIRDLVKETFGTTYKPKEILQVLAEVTWLTQFKLLYREEGAGVRCRVLYQGVGMMERDEFVLTSTVDAKMIFREHGIFCNLWTPSCRAALLSRKERNKSRNQ